MLVHPGREPEPDDQIVMKVLRDQLGTRVWGAHRLDRPTSGVLLFSLSEPLFPHVRRLFEWQAVSKQYVAIVCGKTQDQWTAENPLQKDPQSPTTDAETHFRRVNAFEIDGYQFSSLKVYPQTGRFHQIRKHLATGGFPIVGDYLYGDIEEMDSIVQATGSKGLMLHAKQLGFTHPVNSEDICIDARIPERFFTSTNSPQSIG